LSYGRVCLVYLMPGTIRRTTRMQSAMIWAEFAKVVI
jgi:hypothetical protein